jgi:DNA invertase Pin-like site-specific DNA recombinase
MKQAVIYYRVSTKRQGYSGLGLKAQRNAVKLYARNHKIEIIKEYKEIESTRKKKHKRPKLMAALADCTKTGAVLLIAKIDRLDRNVAFISALMESDIEFIAVDNPNANKLMRHIIAAFAEHERDQISIRIKEALAVAKRNGVELGKYGKKVLSKKNKREADKFARKMKPILSIYHQQGFRSVRKLAHQLNEDKVRPFTGKNAKWHPSSVYAIQKRIYGLEIS